MLLARSDNTLELLGPFAEELARLQPGDPQAERVLAAVSAAQLDDLNAAYVMFIGLMQALNDLSPEGMYFGPSADDVTAFGWWPIAEAERMAANGIRQELYPLREEQLRELKFRGKKKELAEPFRAPGALEEKLRQTRYALECVNELQEAGALFIHNNSGGKDSQAMLIYMVEVLGIPVEQIVSIHADLGEVEYQGTKEKAQEIADHYGIPFFSVRHSRDIPLTERFVERIVTHVAAGRYQKTPEGNWELTATPAPDEGSRWCTSEFKTAPCDQLSATVAGERAISVTTDLPLTQALLVEQGEKDAAELLTSGTMVVVKALGLRAEEAPKRALDAPLDTFEYSRKSKKAGGRPYVLLAWNPIQLLLLDDLKAMISAAGQELHWVYGEGLGRASCSFCVFASKADLALAAKLRPDLYVQYVAIEQMYGKTLTMKRKFLEEVTGIQADAAQVAHYKQQMVPLEELIEEHGWVREQYPEGQIPEKVLGPIRRSGFRGDGFVPPAGQAPMGEHERPPPRRELVPATDLVRKKPLHAQEKLSDEEFFSSLEMVPNAALPPVVLNWGMGADSSNILARVLLDDRSREELGIAPDYSNLIVLTAQVGHEYDETKRLGEKYILPLLRERNVRFVQVGRSSPVTADWRVIEDTRQPYTLHTEGAGFTLGDEMHAAATVPQYRASSRLCSQKFKGVPLDGWLEQEFGDRHFVQLMGFNADELSRAERDDSYTAKGDLNRTARYPLIEWGVGRNELERELEQMFEVHWAKSCCGFCPFQGTKAGRAGVLTRAANEPERAADAMWMELISTSLNPKQTLYASKGGAIGFYREGGAAAAVAAVDRRLAESAWGLYHVRRALFQTATGNKQGARDLKLVAAGTRVEMAAELAELASRLGISIEESEYGILRLWVERRQEGVPETREELYVVAPKAAADKIGRAFEKRWVAGAPRTALRMAPASTDVELSDEEFFASLEMVPNSGQEPGDFFFGEPPAMAPNASELPAGFEGFGAEDLFESHVPVLESTPRRELEAQLGEMPSLLDAEQLVKPAGVAALARPAIYAFQRNRVWLVEVNATTAQQAATLGERVRRNLVSKRALTAADPFLHDLPLFVSYRGGVVKLEPPAAEPKGETLADRKHRIVRKAKNVFGESGTQLTGGAGDYRLLVKPALKEWRGVFTQTTVRAPTLDELDAKLDDVIAAAQGMREPLLPNARKPRRVLGPPTHVSTGKMPKVLSYGGGLDSFAMLLGAIERKEKLDYVVFVNVGSRAAFLGDPTANPGEWPSTYQHIREVVIPLCEEQGIPFVMLDDTNYPVRQGGKDQALDAYDWMVKKRNIPVARKQRNCTATFKVERFENWMRDTFGDETVEVWIGFEANETDRMAKDPHAGVGISQRQNRYPLNEWHLCRCRAERYVRELGYPVPRKSACMFCPYGSKGDWRKLYEEIPGTFARIAKLETDKPSTDKENLKLTILNWGKWELSRAQHAALQALNAGQPESQINKATLWGLERRQWVQDGRITEYGREVLALVPPGAKVTDHIPPERRIANVHYQAPTLYEALEIGDEDDDTSEQCEVCGANPKATKQTGCDYLPPEEGVGPEQLTQLRVPMKASAEPAPRALKAPPERADVEMSDEEFFGSLEIIQ